MIDEIILGQALSPFAVEQMRLFFYQFLEILLKIAQKQLVVLAGEQLQNVIIVLLQVL